MDEFKIKPSQIRAVGDSFLQLSREIQVAGEDARSIATQLRGKIVCHESIGNRLKIISNGIDTLDKRMNDYSKVANTIAGHYETTEKRIIGFVDSKGIEARLDTIDGNNSNTNESSEEKKKSWSWKEGKISGESEILGFDSNGEAEGHIGKVAWDSKIQWGTVKIGKDNDNNVEVGLKDLSLIAASISGSASIVSGSAKGNIGLLSGEVSADVGKIGAKGDIKLSLVEDGKFQPQAKIGAEVSATALTGEAKAKFGTEQLDVHAKAKGTLAHAEATAQGQVGKVEYRDKESGELKESWGIAGKVGAEAYLAEGEISGGLNILGIDINVRLHGKAGGVGVSASGAVTTGGISCGIGAGLGLGAGIDISIDWSNFKWIW